MTNQDSLVLFWDHEANQNQKTERIPENIAHVMTAQTEKGTILNTKYK